MSDIEKIKEYLQSYKNLCCKLRSLEEQMQGKREEEQSAKTQKLSDMPKGNKQSDLSDIMVMLEVLETKIILQKEECLKRKIEIESMIVGIQDGVESLILRRRYIEFKEWTLIAKELSYSKMQVFRIHDVALNKINVIECYS